ncbi:MAG: L,D-transpeptidase family protein [Propionibacteriales bacterium]|nr:L,D-transpeptidase family protein [Propionibacteriales bacterium]
MHPRIPRAAASVLAATVGVLALGGAVGLWPVGAAPGAPETATMTSAAPGAQQPLLRPVLSVVERVTAGDLPGPTDQPAEPAEPAEETPPTQSTPAASGTATAPAHDEIDLPARSGSGRRVVFDISDQRVWLVEGSGAVVRTYPVSGSKHDNLAAGSYRVYSRSRHATSFTNVETMEFMVRFARGDNAAIGFHDIPVDPTGRRVQKTTQIGETLSAGCIRQRTPDAKALWRFAPVDTRVIVLD